MREDQHRFLTLLGQLPARLTAEQAAWMLNCQAHDVPILVATRLLKPLGNPPLNGVKFFSTADVLELSRDRAWLVKMTNAVCQHWQRQNVRRKGRSVSASPSGTSLNPNLAGVG
jgi:hypothetical protein